MEICYPRIVAEQKTGYEEFIGTDATLLDFWRWAHSDLVDNMERGKLAEFIVALALGVEKQITPSWAPYDLLSQEGIKIEVKTSAYIQAWGQTKLSSLSFGIQPTHEYNDVNSTFAEASVRQSDVYVFCVQNHKEQETLNTLDLKQWEFYILKTNKLNEACGGQKHIGIKKLLKLGAVKADYGNLREEILTMRNRDIV